MGFETSLRLGGYCRVWSLTHTTSCFWISFLFLNPSLLRPPTLWKCSSEALGCTFNDTHLMQDHCSVLFTATDAVKPLLVPSLPPPPLLANTNVPVPLVNPHPPLPSTHLPTHPHTLHTWMHTGMRGEWHNPLNAEIWAAWSALRSTAGLMNGHSDTQTKPRLDFYYTVGSGVTQSTDRSRNQRWMPVPLFQTMNNSVTEIYTHHNTLCGV